VADVLFYNGDGVPNLVGPERIRPELGPGYDFDVCNEEVLLERLSVDNARLVLPDGMSYRLLVLPDNTRMPARVARKLKELVEAGATIIGPRPERDPGLLNHPECDEEVRRIAVELWDAKLPGSGRVIENKTPREVLLADGILPDFDYKADGDAHLDFIHRADETAHWYFVVNRNVSPVEAELTFRQDGLQPELWNPVTGEQRLLTDWSRTGEINPRTRLTYQFGPQESAFIVFRQPAGKSHGRNTSKFDTVQTVPGPWNLQFDPDWFYPVEANDNHERVWNELIDWTTHEDPAVKYYAGTATYRTVFHFPEDPDEASEFHLALGEVSFSARVILNGTDLGVAWCAPWQLKATDALKKGRNELVIEVVNTWQNRLVGDGFLPEDQRRTRTNIGHFYRQERRGKKITHPLMPAGLKGPVSLVRKIP